jgi:hypothetical protein
MSDPSARICSEASLATGEPLAGTASDARFFAAVSWPKTLWHHDKVALSEGLPKSLGELEKAARQAGQKLQLRLFQRASGAAKDRVEVICADFLEARTAQLQDLPADRSAASIAEFLAGGGAAKPLERPLLLVCTDGKHDLCCGKLGRALFASLRADARLDVAEVSHLGGHRLAANCLALPSGELYGRVAAADARALVDSLQHDRVYLPRYRGRSGFDELAQVSLAAVLERFPEATGIRIGAAADADGARVLPVELRAGDGIRRIAVRCVAREFRAIASCGDALPERRDRWVVASTQMEET